MTQSIVNPGEGGVNTETTEARRLTENEMQEIQDGLLQDADDDQDEDDAELFHLQRYEDAIEAQRRQDAQVSRAERDYLRGEC